MKSSAVVLLIVAFCIGRASSLHCYRCQNAKSHGECKETTQCADMEKVCVTLMHQDPAQEFSISKWCALKCPTFKPEFKEGKANFSVDCCEENYCNSGGPSSVKTSSALVIMATLASSVYILWTGL